jgi:predicted metal-dependent hydrolase
MFNNVAERVARRARKPQRIHVRRMDFPFDRSIEKHWFGGSPVLTHVANAVNLLFPAGERFFVRSVRHFLDRVDDDELRAAAKAFAAQEGNHAREHERYFELLEQQGYEIREFLERYQKFSFGVLEPMMPPAVRLSATAAAEHFTAIMAEAALRDGLLQDAHPTMRALLLWHACEEIEHKSVAFDVLERVDPRYSVRVAGALIAALNLGAWWFMGARMLLRQDRLDPVAVRRELRHFAKERPLVQGVFLRGIREYLTKDFHPWNNDNGALAERYLESIGRATA